MMTPEEQSCWDSLVEKLDERDRLLREAQGYGIPSELYLRIDAALASETAADQPPAALTCEHGNMVGGCVACALQPPAIIGSEIKPDNQSLSAQLAAAGYTKRDARLQCDECGGMFTPQMLPVHNCTADKSGEAGK